MPAGSRTTADQAQPSIVRRILVYAAYGISAAAVVAFYFWSLHTFTPLQFDQRQADYYSLQVHGWRKGTLAMDITPHPELRVEYPNRITQTAPFPLDASYYEGSYYLYFGPTPALLLLLPYHLATGFDLPEAFAAAFFASLGFVLSVLWMGLLVREFFPRSSRWGVVACCLCALALANVATATLSRPLFYEVAIASGYAFSQACVLAATFAMIRPSRRLLWLALASLCAGLAMGSRPNLIVGGALLIPIVVAGIWWQGARTWPHARRLLLAGGLPAAVCVSLLLGYNYARFDRLFEFGNNLQLGANPDGFAFSSTYFWHNLKVYFFTAPAVDWFFPFIAPGAEGSRPPGYYGLEEAGGQFVILPALLLAAGAAAGLLIRNRRTFASPLVVLSLGIFAWSLGVFLIVAAAGVRANRYMMDFQPMLVVGLVVVFLRAAHDPSRVLRWISRVGAANLLVVSGYNLLLGFQASDAFRLRDAAEYASLEQKANRAVAPLLGRFGPALGTQAWKLSLPAGFPGKTDPLVVAGTIAGYDALYVRYTATDRAYLTFEHSQHGMITGPEFTFVPDREMSGSLTLGTFFPPVGHPWYGSKPTDEQQRLRNAAQIILDGNVLLDSGIVCYVATPSTALLGERGIAPWGEDKFSGRIRLEGAFAPPPEPAYPPAGLVEEIEVRLPTQMTGQREPLLTYGSSSSNYGDGYFIEYSSVDSVRFGHDSAGILSFSDPIPVDYARTQKLAFEFKPSGAVGGQRGLFRVFLGEKLVYESTFWSRLSPGAGWISFANPRFSSACRQVFTGLILRRSPPLDLYALGSGRNQHPFGLGDAIAPDWRERPNQAPSADLTEGPIEIRLAFPPARSGGKEPLVVSGATGQADSIYVHYLDAGHIAFGFDNWGSASPPESSAIAIDSAKIHVLTIDYDALHPNSRPRTEQAIVRLNGVEVWRIRARCHPYMENTIAIGENSVGMSTSDRSFTGRIYHARGIK